MAPFSGNRMEKENKKIASRGIPSEFSFYLPAYNSPELRKFEDESETPTRNLWHLDEVINFIFPKKYQQTYNEVAIKFLELLASKVEVEGKDISEFLKQNSISKATFYNRVFPKLRKSGLIKVRRETITSLESKRKYRPMHVSLSKTFGNYITKIGESWLAIVDDARTRKK